MSDLRIAVALSDPLDAPTPPPSSCGLDFWQSDEASEWVCGYLDARPASLQVVAGGRSASLRLLLRRLPLGMSAESSKSGQSEPLDNLELDLQPAIEETWKSLSELPRRCVRKAVRMGVRIHWRSSEAMLATQEELVSATYDRQGIRPNIPQRLYRELLARRKDIGLRVLSATHSGKTVAAIWVLSDTRTCHYWDAASLEDARELNANHLQVWCLIRWAYRRGLKKLDFVGTSSGGRAGTRPGIARFKRSMGGQPVEYRILYWYSPLMLVSRCAVTKV